MSDAQDIARQIEGEVVALGACAVEKRFTLARADGGPDAAFSLEPVAWDMLELRAA